MQLTRAARDVIETWRLGFVATVTADGLPNVSPKGTFIVVDAETIAFAEMRSPATVENLRRNPELEVNFVDILSRRGVRIRGHAELLLRGTAPFGKLMPRFTEHWEDLSDMFNLFVRIPVREVRPLVSPIYEAGGEEAALREQWKRRIAAL